MSISDTESDTPFSASFSGPNGNLQFVPQNSSSYVIKTTGTINSGVTYSYTSVHDNFDKSTSYKKTITLLTL